MPDFLNRKVHVVQVDWYYFFIQFLPNMVVNVEFFSTG